MTPAPDSLPTRRIALLLSQALQRLHNRLNHSDDDEPQPKRKSAATQRRPTAKRKNRKQSQAA